MEEVIAGLIAPLLVMLILIMVTAGAANFMVKAVSYLRRWMML